jgi:hypothetical protein
MTDFFPFASPRGKVLKEHMEREDKEEFETDAQRREQKD